MRPTPYRMLAGRSATCAVVLAVSTALPAGYAQAEKVNQGLHAAGSAVSQGASLLGGALPGGAVISAAVSSVSSLGGGAGGGASSAAYAATGRIGLTPSGGGETVSSDLAEDGSFAFKGLKPGTYHLRISMNVTVPKQTQGATFGEKVNQGLATAGTAKTKHDTAKNSVGNIRARTSGNEAGSGAEKSVNNINGGMPNRISMNVTVAKQNLTASEDGETISVQVGEDGTLTGRATQQAQGAEPASSGRGGPEPAGPSGAPPPRPAGG